MAKEPIFSATGTLNLRAWDADLARRETGKRSVDRQTVAQLTEVRALIMDDLAKWWKAWIEDCDNAQWSAFKRRIQTWKRKVERPKNRRKAPGERQRRRVERRPKSKRRA